MSMNFYQAMEARRSIYGISKETVIPDLKIEEIINHAVKHVPSAFNSQTGRVIMLYGKHHDKLWSIVKEALRKIVPADQFSDSEQKINAFANGYGSILFFEDMSIVESLQQQFEIYKDNFPLWSMHSSGMLQYAVWTSLSSEGMGASLQHYNELIEDEVKKQWDIPKSWKLIAQMPYDKPIAPAGEKEYMPLEDRVKIFK